MRECNDAIMTQVPLLGRAGVFNQRKIFQLFAVIRTPAGAFQVPDRNLLPWGWMSDYKPQNPGDCGDGLAPRDHKCERLWRLSTGSQVAYRPGEGPHTPLSNIDFDAFENPGTPDPAGATTGGYGYFRVRYTITGLTGKYTFTLDVGQTIEIYALQVNASLIGPPNTILIDKDNDAQSASPAQLEGLVVDARIGANFIPIEAPTGLIEARYTQLLFVLANTRGTITVPKYARKVRIYQDSAGASSGPWERWIGPAPICNVGTINFVNRASVDADEDIGRESELRTDLNPAIDRIFQIIWTIRP